MEDEKHEVLKSLQETIFKLEQKLKVVTDERDQLYREKDELSRHLLCVMAESEDLYKLVERRGVEVQRTNAQICF